jgi:hypothetical protein
MNRFWPLGDHRGNNLTYSLIKLPVYVSCWRSGRTGEQGAQSASLQWFVGDCGIVHYADVMVGLLSDRTHHTHEGGTA